ncbi:MAG: DUF348 domain-containing protein [Ruminococcus sp.]|nr:DUF348 domain-containing protein [Ruminococcus sp.]
MTIFSDKKRFVQLFCGISVVTLMACSSLVTVAAAIAGASAPTEIKVQATTEAPAPKKVVLDVNGNQKTMLFSGETVEELLRVSNIMVNDNQIVLPGRAEMVTPYMVVTVRDAKAVELTDGGKSRTVMLACGTVEDALKLAGIALGSEDKLSVDRSAQVEAIDSLTIRRAE